MIKSELIKFSANKVKNDITLFTEYLRIYEEELGYAPACGSCSFKSTFNSWKKTPITIKSNTMAKNTFKLRNENLIYRLSDNPSLVLGKNSTDEVALMFLNGEKGKYRTEREKNFRILPTEVTKKENKKTKNIKK